MQRKRPEAVPKGKPSAEEAPFEHRPGAMFDHTARVEAVVHASEEPSPLMRSEINPSEVRASIKRKMAEAERIEDASFATEVEDGTTAVGRPVFGTKPDTADGGSSRHYSGSGEQYGMNSRQLTALWIGAAAAVAILLFPPGPNWPAIYYRSGQHILDVLPPLIAVAIVSAAAVYSLKDRSSR